MATWAVGDVHGCSDKLRRLWVALAPSKRDEVVLLGDLVDRGPDPRGVLDFVLEKRAEGYRVLSLLGNHEELLLRWHADPSDEAAWNLWMLNGGGQTLGSYGLASSSPLAGAVIPEEHLRFLRSLPLWHRVKDVTFVHAGLRPRIPLERQERDDLLWIREAFFGHPEQFSAPVVFGHTPFPRVFRSGPLVGIDTGAVHGLRNPRFGRLTAYEPFLDRVVQVE